jgi:hypothetical protein
MENVIFAIFSIQYPKQYFYFNFSVEKRGSVTSFQFTEQPYLFFSMKSFTYITFVLLRNF